MKRTGSARGRGAGHNPANRYAEHHNEPVDDGWWPAEEEVLRTELIADRSRSIIARNQSPDVPFDRSVNPYRGCEHGCIYCFARPGHAWLGYSPGLDFESRILYKPDAAELLRAELARPGYRCAPIALGANTDAWQPVERRLRITRAVLEVLADSCHPVMVITKSAAIERDIDLLAPMAAQGLVSVALSITTLQPGIARALEPRATAPARRMQTIARLSDAGIPVRVQVAPVIPFLTDEELEAILTAARDAGATSAGYILLRLPQEVGGLFQEWLQTHFPLKAGRVMEGIRASRDGREDDPRFGSRMRGSGPLADLIAQRFRLACRRLGFDEPPDLTCDLFRPPLPGGQMALFD